MSEEPAVMTRIHMPRRKLVDLNLFRFSISLEGVCLFANFFTAFRCVYNGVDTTLKNPNVSTHLVACYSNSINVGVMVE